MQDRDGAGWSLQIVASAGQDGTVKAILGRGVQVNAAHQNDCTLLHHTASKSRHKTTVMLLEDAKDNYEAAAMHWAAPKCNLKMIHIQDTEGNL